MDWKNLKKRKKTCFIVCIGEEKGVIIGTKEEEMEIRCTKEKYFLGHWL